MGSTVNQSERDFRPLFPFVNPSLCSCKPKKSKRIQKCGSQTRVRSLNCWCFLFTCYSNSMPRDSPKDPSALESSGHSNASLGQSGTELGEVLFFSAGFHSKWRLFSCNSAAWKNVDMMIWCDISSYMGPNRLAFKDWSSSEVGFQHAPTIASGLALQGW